MCVFFLWLLAESKFEKKGKKVGIEFGIGTKKIQCE